jgi:rRNA maturation RNase YbeY
MIEFQTQNVEMPQIDVELVRRWIGEVAARHGKTVGPQTYCFCDDSHIIEVNRQFLQHDFYTDIITFDYTRRNRISGDMLISLDTVASNAEMLGMAYDQELHRVIIHGVLHLCGIDDKGEGEREIMEAHEDDALSIFQRLKQSES